MEKKYVYDYPMPAITTDCVIFRGSFHEDEFDAEVLLIKRKNDPFKDCWALPGGYLEPNETVIKCCVREVKEETGINLLDYTKVDKDFNVKIYDAIDRDPRQRTISIMSIAHVNDSVDAVAGDDAIELAWFRLDDLWGVELAFDHAMMIEDAIQHRMVSMVM